jgi:hypothetical protein
VFSLGWSLYGAKPRNQACCEKFSFLFDLVCAVPVFPAAGTLSLLSNPEVPPCTLYLIPCLIVLRVTGESGTSLSFSFLPLWRTVLLSGA